MQQCFKPVSIPSFRAEVAQPGKAVASSLSRGSHWCSAPREFKSPPRRPLVSNTLEKALACGHTEIQSVCKMRRNKQEHVSSSDAYILRIGEAIKFDADRFSRKGFPEIIYGQGKSLKQLSAICEKLNMAGQPAIISRIDEERSSELKNILSRKMGRRAVLTHHSDGRVFVSLPAGWKRERIDARFKIAIVTGGSSDVRVAYETIAVLDTLGYMHDEFFDCGIAGLHRSVDAAGAIQRGNYCVAIVYAGMEGALASVMAALLDIPIIGVPISSGYGAGGEGVGALQTMLQSCVPGLTVVNIDNGIGAAAAAVSIIRQFRKSVA